ncbi:MAG: tRNA (N(6)-L-threonylcarbamoyladenosine(37)-C(2))-methylthiotransferase [Candidatus Pacearchaeota archaeon]|nr:tRNA (N(6)-L-threonylcarbamoyladenosine(37)-C(2))-methylthiotransferase [Candidatus Pacearchaeota archaeon]
MPYSIYLETYGCTANTNDAEMIKGLLASHGFNITNNEHIADVIIINTCVVKDPTIKKIEIRIKHFLELKKKLIISGCMPEVQSKRLEKLAPQASLVSHYHIKEISKAVKNLLEGKHMVLIGKSNKDETKLGLPKAREKQIIGISQVCQGCLGSCAYCYTKQAKGSLFSFPEDQIIKNVEQDIAAGCKEIWLTSQDNVLYGIDFEENTKKVSQLPRLINKICDLKHKFFLRVGMMNPEYILPVLDELIESYQNEKVYKFLHIPIQSGSDKVLKLMNRKYQVKDSLEIVDGFKKEFPSITISTDIIVGFPGETEEDFQKTLGIISKIKPDVLNISRFWAMPDTEAAKLKQQISPSIKRERATKLMNLHAKIALENKILLINKEYKVLVDEKGFKDTWLARNENYQLIILRSQENLLGKFLKVRIKEAKAHYLIGELVQLFS